MKGALLKILLLLQFRCFACNDTTWVSGRNFGNLNSIIDGIDRTVITIQPKTLLLDTIKVTFKKSIFKIETTSYFSISGSTLLIDYYFNGSILPATHVQGKSRQVADMHKGYWYYNENDSCVYARYYCCKRPCMPAPRLYEEMNRFFKYNPYLNVNFIKTYINILLNRIKPPLAGIQQVK